MIWLGLDFVLVICTTEFSTFWKTSDSGDWDDAGWGDKLGRACTTAFDDRNK
jgi:hypothetical protein